MAQTPTLPAIGEEVNLPPIGEEVASQPVSAALPVTTARPSTNIALGFAGAGKATRTAADIATELATNPKVPYIGSKIGRAVGAVAPVVAGAQEGGLVGAMVGMAASAKTAWAGGRTGWFSAKLAQNIAAPAADILVKATPYMKALNRFAGPQSALDLAQLADPNRRDIGVLGIGSTQHVPGEHPALVNLAVQKIGDSIKSLMGYGLKAEDAAALLLDFHGTGKP